jgi:nicotinamidase-related amidase
LTIVVLNSGKKAPARRDHRGDRRHRATNMGVESTARAGHEHGYAVVLAEDAATTFSAEMHAFAFEHIFPHLGRVAKADEIEL